MTTNTPQAALGAAEKVAAEADAALTVARAAVPAAASKLAELEAAVRAGGHATKADLAKARAEIEETRGDVEWSTLQLEAAEVAHSRASDDVAAAHRRVTADEYLAAHKAHNDPEARERVLTAQLSDVMAELIGLIDTRERTHHRLALDVESWPADEKADLNRRLGAQADGYPGGRPRSPITTYGAAGLGHFPVTVPKNEVAEAIKAGVQAAQR